MIYGRFPAHIIHPKKDDRLFLKHDRVFKKDDRVLKKRGHLFFKDGHVLKKDGDPSSPLLRGGRGCVSG